ncbi:AAA family ATPase [Candidatus Saccharibacteria bacterium]|nr:AAA family ATPase [Candidatus Saccharibacteria bacterium]
MRISHVEIKNYRSIEEISFKVLDPSIACFIGGNGSGKSNILRAIAAMKNSDKFDEDDFYVEASDEDEIRISLTFILEKSDAELLEPVGLKLQNVSGFKVTKVQKLGGKPTIYSELLGYDDILEKRLDTRLNAITRAITAELKPEDDQEAHLKLGETIRNRQETKEAITGSLTNLLTTLKQHVPDISTLNLDEKELQVLANFKDYQFAYDGLFSQLDIELLSLDEYQIANEAPIEELASRVAHPFLFDLLSISGKTSTDFLNAEGNKRINISEQASEQLTATMQKVWGSHGLPLVVLKDKKDTTLSFCSRTPNQKAIPLESASKGTQWFLRFYTRLITARNHSKRIIWLFDEPDLGLHAKSQQDLVKLIEEQSADSQVLYSTHQPIMIQWHRLERIHVVENMPESKQAKFGKGTKIHQRFWDDGDFDSPLKEILKLFIGEDILWTKEHVVIEGPSDYFYFVGWANRFAKENPNAKIWNDEFSSPSRAFVPAGSITNIPLFLFFLTKRNGAETVNWASVTDTGKDHTDIKQVINSTSRLKRFSDRVISLERPEGDKIEKDFDVEDLFDRQEFYDKAAEYYKAAYPECNFPKYKDLSSQEKITKTLTTELKRLNKEKIPKISFDKPGVAQHIYYQLVVENKPFSDVSSKNFRATLNAINKTFSLEPTEQPAA